VTPDSALRAAAFAACRRVLVTEVAQLPVHTFTSRGGGRRRVDDPPIVDAPSILTRRAWVAQMMDGLTREGNAYLRAYGGGLSPSQVETLPVGSVSWQTIDGVLTPFVGGERQRLWPDGDLIHVPASAFITAGNPVAASPVDVAAQAISTGLAAERYVGEWFGSGGHPTSIIYAEDEAMTREKAEAVKDAYLAATRSRRPAVLGSGYKREAAQEKVDESAINAMRFAVEQACRFMGVPPSMVYASISGQAVTYANVTDSDLQLLKHSLGIWLGDIEDHWSRWIGVKGRYVRFNVDALLRVTPKERHEIHKLRLDSKTTTVNEVRALEDEEPFTGAEFNEPGIPQAAGVPAQLQLEGIAE
jgi:HK97 family phage portal protein